MDYAKSLSMSAAVLTTAATLFVFAPPASAKEKPIIVEAQANPLVRRVAFADLDLASKAGRQALNSRVGDAVTDLCLEATGGFMARAAYDHRASACASDAWDAARPQIALAIERGQQLASTGAAPLVASAITLAIRA